MGGFGIACLAGLLALLASVPAGACDVTMRASLPIVTVGGLFLVPVAVNGHEEDFVLDTGAERTVVGTEAARRLGLARDEWVSSDMQGAGGVDRRPIGRPRSLSLGGVALVRHTVAADNSVVVGPIPAEIDGHPVAGLLGQDFLSVFDLDLDAAAGRLTLQSLSGCTAAFRPWGKGTVVIQAARPARNILAVAVRVDGHAMLAELDTGDGISLLMAPGMVALGVAPGGADQVRGFGAGGTAARRQDFTVQVGALPADRMRLVVSPIHGLRSLGMLLGADWVAGRRLWISWATNQLFVPG